MVGDDIVAATTLTTGNIFRLTEMNVHICFTIKVPYSYAEYVRREKLSRNVVNE